MTISRCRRGMSATRIRVGATRMLHAAHSARRRRACLWIAGTQLGSSLSARRDQSTPAEGLVPGAGSHRARAAARSSGGGLGAPRGTPSLSRMRCTWFLTVGSSMHSSRAISLFESPWSTSSTIWSSRTVSLSGAGTRAASAGARRSRASVATRRSSTAAVHGEHGASPRADARDGRDEVVERGLGGQTARDAGLRAGDDVALARGDVDREHRARSRARCARPPRSLRPRPRRG